MVKKSYHPAKSFFKFPDFSGPHFPVFRLNMEIY